MEEQVEFPSNGDLVRGILYRPENSAGPLPTVVMAGGWCYVKEIVLATYGREPADKVVKEFVFHQLWYSPKRDFSAAGLTESQKALLNRIDAKRKSR